MDRVRVGTMEFGGPGVILIAGPCVIESRAHAYGMAEKIKKITSDLGIDLVFKASFDKANRSSIDAFRGPGIKKGLEILGEIRNDLNLPVICDIHEPLQAGAAQETLDIIQIPAFLCRQTDLLVAAGQTGLPVSVKKGQFMAPWDMKNVVAKIQSTGNNNIILTERGASFGYNNLVCDLRSLGIMRAMNHPVVLDVTHSLQLPGGKGSSSGGNREFIAPLARAGIAFGVDALFMEVHDRPDMALSDGPNSLDLKDLKGILGEIKAIRQVVERE